MAPPPGTPAAPGTRVRALVKVAVPGEYIVTVLGMEERPPWLHHGARLTAHFITSLGVHQGQCDLVAINGAGTIDNPLELTLSELTGVKTLQRRKHFRVAAALPVDLEVLRTKNKELAEEAADRNAVTQDFSAGGLRVETRFDLELDDQLRMTLPIPSELRQGLPEYLICVAYVVRVEVLALGQFKVAMQSSFPREIGRDRWVQLTLNLQRGRG